MGRSAQVSITEVSASPDGKGKSTDSGIRSIRRSGLVVFREQRRRELRTVNDGVDEDGELVLP